MSAWSVVVKFAWMVLGGLVTLGIVVMFWPQYQQYREYQARESRLQTEVMQEEAAIKRLKQNQERFRSDPRFVETIAHELGLAKEGETLYKFHETTAAPAVVRTTKPANP